jgi:glycosyltransferase involved in cell wall biosynthesis
MDATAIPADRRGVGRYVDAVAPALLSEGIDLVIAAQARDAEVFSSVAPGAEVVAVKGIEPRPARLVWEQTLLPRLARTVRADVLHSPHYTMPQASPIPVVVTVHDATFFSLPELHSQVKVRFFRAAIRSAIRRAQGIVVPSVATRDEVIRYVGGDPSQFHVAYHGVDAETFHPVSDAERARVRAALGIADAPYVAFLGTLEPRKNIPALIAAWSQVAPRHVPAPALLLAGGRGWDDRIEAALDQVPEHLTAKALGYLPIGDLAAFLGDADVVAYPSLGEGFGLPVLEAMACGAAVLTTRELALPEVGGSAVEYCSPDVEAMASQLDGLLSDEARRAELSAAARERAATFTWSRCAQDHVRAFQAAVGARDDRSDEA